MCVVAFGLLTNSPVAQAGVGAVACFVKAEPLFGMGRFQALQLCSDAESTAPAECYEQALQGQGLSNIEARDLCVGAESNAPLQCFFDSQQRMGLNRFEARVSCAGTRAATGVSSCMAALIPANSHLPLLGRAQALTLCAGAADESPAQCWLSARNDARLAANDGIELCRIRDRFRK